MANVPQPIFLLHLTLNVFECVRSMGDAAERLRAILVRFACDPDDAALWPAARELADQFTLDQLCAMAAPRAAEVRGCLTGFWGARCGGVRLRSCEDLGDSTVAGEHWAVGERRLDGKYIAPGYRARDSLLSNDSVGGRVARFARHAAQDGELRQAPGNALQLRERRERVEDEPANGMRPPLQFRRRCCAEDLARHRECLCPDVLEEYSLVRGT